MTEKVAGCLGDHRLRRPRGGRARDGAGAAQPVQARHRALARHRGALGQGALRQGVGRVRRPRRSARTGTGGWGSGARRSSRCARSTTTSPSSTSSSPTDFCRREQVLLVLASTSARATTRSRPRVQEGEGQAAVPADERRRARSSTSRTRNYENRGELLLKHQHEGIDLKLDHARDTLANLTRVWKRPCNILTKMDGKGKVLRFDGRDHSERSAEYK